MRHILLEFVSFAALVWQVSAQGMVVFDETINGPIGHSIESETLLGTIPGGTGLIYGTVDLTVVRQGYQGDPDVAQFQVGAGWQLTSLRFSAGGPANMLLTGVSPDDWLVRGYSPPTVDLVQQMGHGPLQSGTYNFVVWNNDYSGAYDGSHVGYVIELAVEPVPEPGALPLALLAGAACLACSRRWRTDGRSGG